MNAPSTPSTPSTCDAVQILTEDWQIELARLASAKAAIKLEAVGMRHSRLGSLRKRWAVHLGLKPNTRHDLVIAAIQVKMNAIKEAHNV